MWSKVVVLCLVAASAYTSNSPAWKDNTEYVYTVRGRTLTSLDDLAAQYSGIQLKAKLHITLKSEGKLHGSISEPQYAQIHSHLPRGWEQTIPDSELHYKQLSWTDKPFEMEMEHGLIRALIVEKELANWEVNMIKSIVSQFQLDVQGKNAIESPINIHGMNNDAVFKTVEETITGRTETTYNIHKLLEYYIQTQPELVPQRQLRGDGDIIEVIKSKNFTNSSERPSYHFGLKEICEHEPTSNNVEELLTRTSDSRAILTGKLTHYTVQSIYTVDKILVSPTWSPVDMGSVVSALNISLVEVQTRSRDPQELSNPVKVGDLVYTYENPSATQAESKRYGSEEQPAEESQEHLRYRRYASQMIQKLSGEIYQQQLREQQQPTPKMENAPELPLLPYFIGYHGKSIKESGSFDLKQNVKKIAQDISKDLKDSDSILMQATLSKYTILSSLIRLMNQEELRTTSEEIFTLSRQEGQQDVWNVYRDAVAETGTGPAFLTIKEWIETKKIKNQEAALVVATLASSIRTPTFEYMHKFFDLIRSHEVVSQSYLNETAILSYSNLVQQVYVNRNVSHNQYPVHSFGQFSNEEGEKFMKESIIPYYAQQLDKAIQETDTKKIHVYIRALGNIGHKQILSAFEKYLEGKKQCSQFQRLMMVVSLDRLAIAYPEIARAVLYRIYQNTGELQQIRVAAVYQIMRTNPPKEMIQYMAHQTNFDKQQEVNAAVKSCIENLWRLRSPKHEYLRQAGEAAKHLLNKRVYGVQNSMYLKDYVTEGFTQELVAQAQYMTEGESYWPNAIKLTFNKHMNDIQFLNFEAMVSSVKELTNVLYEQTHTYEEEQKSQKAGQSKFSSPYIAGLLKLDINQKEQLEGFFQSEMGVLSSIFSYDNRSLEMLPEYIRQQEEIYKNGKQFSYTKMGHAKELALSFPTVMGFPFLYTYDIPLLVKVEGKTKMVASPAVSQNKKLVRPDEISGEIESEIVLSGKVESHLSFITPFDHQQYFAGYNRNLHFRVPVKAHVKIDLKNKQGKFEINTSQVDERRIIHYSSWPYTSRSDIMTVIPVARRPNTQYIKQENQRYFNTVLGQKSTGIAFKVWGNHHEQEMNLGYLAQVFRTEGPMGVWEHLIKNGRMEHSEFNVAPQTGQTSTKKVTLYFGHQYKYVKSAESQHEDVSKWFSQDYSKSSDRQQEMMKYASSGLKSADVSVCDMLFEFSGQTEKQYSFTVGTGKSNAYPRSNVFAYLRRYIGQELDQAAFKVKAEVSNTNGLDMAYSMENKPQAKYQYQFLFESKNKQRSEVQGKIEMERSEERKNYLVNQPEYQQCKREMQQGNHQLEACANMTIRANFFDKMEFELTPKNLNEQVKHFFRQVYAAAKFYFYPSSTVTSQATQDETIRMQMRFQPGYEYFNVTLQTIDEQTKIQDIHVPETIRPFVMVHPVFHLKSRVFGKLAGFYNYRPFCVIDKTAARTFSGWTYPVNSQDQSEWTVMMQYLPKQARQQEEPARQQLKKQIENFVVLVRKEQQKEMKIVFNAPETHGNEVEITLKANSNGAPTVQVNEQKLELSENNYSEDHYDGYVQAYLLPNNEVKVELRGIFYVIFDGERVKLTTLSDKFRNSVVGLCGRNNDDFHSDMLTPERCVARTPSEFIQSYRAGEKRNSESQSQCIPLEYPLYVDVIRSEKSGQYSSEEHEQRGTKLQTRYIEQGHQICFTTRPVPICKHSALTTINKEVPVHCVENTRTAQLFKRQIDQGGNPDFSHKPSHKSIEMELDQQCA